MTLARPHARAEAKPAQKPAKAPRATSRAALSPQDAERQADVAASAIATGAVVPVLGVSEPARRPAGAGPGTPLPGPLRGTFERAFGAELGAVRLHTGPAAHRAAALHGARAFAAGTDVFFAPGQLAVDTVAGREVLAHELAHVLQQTGRPGPDGRLRATAITGGGAVQRAETMVEFMVKNKVFGAAPPLADVLQRHIDGNPGDTALEAETKRVKAILGTGWSTDAAKVAKIVIAAESTKKNKAQRQLYIDCLKALGQHDKAIELLEMKWNVDTAFLSADFYKALRARTSATGESTGLSWLIDRATRRTFTSWFYPKPFVEAFRKYLYDPFAKMPPGAGGANTDAAWKEVQKATPSVTAKGLFDNETGVAAVEALNRLDSARVALDSIRALAVPRTKDNKLDISAGVFATGAVQRWYFKRNVANFIVEKSVGAFFVGLFDESLELLRGVAPELEEIAAQASKFFGRVESLTSAAEGDGEFENLGRADALLSATATDKRFANLKAQLGALAAPLMVRGFGREYDTATYRGVVKNVRDQLSTYGQAYAAQLIKLMSDPAADDLHRLRLSVVLLLLGRIDLALEEYSIDADRKFVEDYKRDDVRLAHRSRTLRMIRRAAALVGLTTVTNQIDTFFKVKQTYLTLLGTFLEVPMTFEEAWVGVRQDLSLKAAIRNQEPLTPGIYQSFIYSLYNEALKIALEVELAQRRGKAIDPSLQPVTVIASQSVDKSLHLLRPRKYVMTAYEGVWTGSEQISDLLFAHPKYADVEKTLIKPGASVAPRSEWLHRRYGVTFWHFPAIDKLQALLAQDAKLQAAVQAAWDKLRARLAPAKQLPEKPATGGDWLEALRLANVGDATDPKKPLADPILADPSLASQAEQVAKAKYDAERTAMIAKSREAANLERAATRQRIQVLKGWTEDDSRGNHLEKLGVPLTVIRHIYNFANTVLIEEDRAYEVAALMLEEAPLFAAEFGPQKVLLVLKTSGTQRTDIITEYLPILRGTLAIWDAKTTHRQTLRQVVGDTTGVWASMLEISANLLRGLLAQFEQTKLSQQRDTGLAGAKGQYVRAWGHSRQMKPTDRWTIDGVKYEMGAVLEDFEYHPTFLRKPSPIEWPQSTKAPDSLLTVGGVDVPGTSRSSRVLFKIKRNGKDVDVTEQHDDLLSELSYSIAMQAIVEQLQALGVGLEIFAEVLMTGVEILQPEVAAARIGVSILQFVMSDEFAALKEMVRKDGFDVVKNIFGEIAKLFDIEQALTWLMFGSALTLADKIKDQPQTSAQQRVVANESKHTSSSAIAKIGGMIKRLITFGKKVLIGFDGGRKVVQAPVRRAQDFIASHPILKVVLRWAVELYDRLQDLKWGQLLDDPAAAVGSEAKQGMEQIVKHIQEAFAKLAELELPEEVLPLQTIVDIAIDMGIARLPGKWKLLGTVVRAVLKTFGWWDKITGAMSDELKSRDMDPNTEYVNQVRSRLEGPFEEYRAELVAVMKDVFLKLGVVIDAQPDKTTIELHRFGEGTPEDAAGEAPASPALRGAGPASVRSPHLDHISGGVPLSPDVRASAESRLGHDFGHVRVHQDSAANAANRAVDSFALTKGSHVMLASDVTPTTSMGSRVLDHELGHVVQHTGPRPLGPSQDPTPRGGGGAARVQIDHAAEAAADRMSASALSGPAGVVRPSARGLFGLFLAKTVEDFRIQERAAKVDKAAKTPEALDPDSEALAKALTETLVTQIEGLAGDPPKNFTAPFNDVAAGAPAAILDYLKKTRRLTALKAAIPVLVARARRKLDMGKPPPEGPAPPPVYRVTPRNLELEIEEYLFGASGVAFEVELNKKDEVPPGGKRARSVVDSGAAGGPVKVIKVRSLYMNFIGGNADLWDKVIEETFAKSPGIATKYTAAMKTEYRRQARVALRVVDRATMWHSTKFRISDGVAKVIEDEVHRKKDSKLAPGDLPPAAVYLTTDPNSASVTAAKATSGHVGLRLGTYRSQTTIEKGTDRESHHTTQFLLFEYLYGDSGDLPVKPLSAFSNLGVGVVGGYVDTITGSTAGKKILVGKYFGSSGNRGPDMPAVLLARQTHQSNVHIPGEKADEGKKASQGGWVHKRFQDALGEDAAGKIIKSDPTKLSTIASGGVVDGVTGGAIKDRIFESACETYKQMRDLMMTRLETALGTAETEYYNSAAQAAGKAAQPAYQLTAGQAMGVIGAIKTHNDQALEKGGAGLERK